MSHALTTTEPVLATTHGGLFKSKLRMQLGRFELTPQRVVYYQKSTLFLLFGALGMLLSRYAAGTRALDLELVRIAAVARGKHGFNKNILDVTMSDGTRHRISLDRFDEFTAQLREQLARQGRLDPAAGVAAAAPWARRPPAPA
ncbi:MAG: hypothetical protein HS111_27230 [Kofleriaceae bacterium]|nr:hypothetical protein [Kofleriaceae bacterium]